MEKLIENSGIPCTFLRCPLPFEHLFLQQTFLAQRKKLKLPLEDHYWAPMALGDIAKASCAILNDYCVHENKAYDMAGPEKFKIGDLAGAFSECLGMQVQWQENISQRDYSGMLHLDSAQF